MHLFYAPDFPRIKELPPEEAAHAIRVLRLQVGDRIQVSTGKGQIFEAIIEEIGKKTCILGKEGRIENGTEPKIPLHVGIAPTKNRVRFEWFLEKACEIGIGEITPLICEHSERKKLNMDRARKVLIAAMKQSRQSRLPVLHAPVAFNDWAHTVDKNTQRFIAHLSPEAKPLSKVLIPGEASVIAVGPEGDFSANELRIARDNGFLQISLGPHRLRSETAGVYVCAAFRLINEIHQ